MRPDANKGPDECVVVVVSSGDHNNYTDLRCDGEKPTIDNEPNLDDSFDDQECEDYVNVAAPESTEVNRRRTVWQHRYPRQRPRNH